MKEKQSFLGTRKHLTILGITLWALSIIVLPIAYLLELDRLPVNIFSMILSFTGFLLWDLGIKKLHDRDKAERIVTFAWWASMFIMLLVEVLTDIALLKFISLAVFCVGSKFKKDIYNY